MTRAAFFTTCIECGSSHPSHSGVCDHCAPLYADDSCDCAVCRSDPGRAGIVPCEKEADHGE